MAALAPHSTNRTKTFSTLAFSVLILGITLSMPSAQLALHKAGVLLRAPDLGRLPLSFEPNAGQAAPEARYMVHSAGGTLLFTSSGVTISLPDEKGASATAGYKNGHLNALQSTICDPQSFSTVGLHFIGASSATSIASGQVLPGKVNYLLGKDRAKWHTGLPTYGSIAYSELYPGISLDYSGTDGRLKGTYTVDPDADPTNIRWRYDGANSVSVDKDGNLQIAINNSKLKTQNSKLTEHAPVAWQEIAGKRIAVSVRYEIAKDGNIGFALGEYDRTRPLIIDPTLTYSTYLGGFYGEGAADIALDATGNIYVTGGTSSSDFPTTPGVFQPVWGGQSDAFVAKLSADGSTLIYSTFLGGDGEIDGGDVGQSISVDAAGNATIGGSTDAENFPTTPDAYQIVFGGSGDMFISKLNADGSDLIFSTYYGDEGVEAGSKFVTDAAGNTYFTGYFEGAANSYALVAGLSADGSRLLFQRSLGGHIPGPGDENANTHGGGIALDSAGNIYVTGDTRASDFPITFGAYRTTIEAFEDGFITKLAPSGQQILYSTYIPGGVSDYPSDIAVDTAGNAYITGNTSSGDFPTTAGAFDTTYGSGRDSFVTKLNPSGSALVYSTFLGGEAFAFDHNEDYGFAIRVDAAESAYVVGYTESPDFPVSNAIQPTIRGPYDAFVTKFNPSGSGLVYSTYLGGSRGDVAGGIALDNNGNAYISGSTSSLDFPMVNPVQPNNHGSSDAFIARIFDPSGVFTPTPTRTGTPPTATRTATATPCAPDADYSFRRYTDVTLVPGTTDTGNHCDDCNTTVALPFPVRFYGQSYSSANLGSNGNIQFVSNALDPYDYDSCSVAFPFLNYAAMPYFSDLDTTSGGIFTSISGTTPNRIFNVEWRACVFDPIKFQCDDTVNFEARLYENSPIEQIDFVYAQLDRYNGLPSVVAVQEGSGSHYRQFSCLQDVLQPGMMVTFYRNTCASPTLTPTGTQRTATATRTRTPSPTPGNCQMPTNWQIEAPMSIVRARSAAAVVNGQLYVIGGVGASPTPYPRTTERFDPSTNAWTSLAPIPLGMARTQAASIGARIYVMGSNANGDQHIMQIYDTSTDTWSTGAVMPEPLGGGGLVAYNGKIYLFGGQYNLPSNHVYEYDPVANTYTAKASMPSGQSEIGAAAVGNRIYVVGGYQYVHYAYDPATDTWTTMPAPLTPSFSVPGVFAFGGELWVEGGYDNPTRRPYPPDQQVQIYNPATNSWHFGPAFHAPRYYSTAAGVIGNRAYVVGGIDYLSDQYPYDYLNSMESITYGPCGSVTPTPTPICTRSVEDVAIESVAYNPLNMTISVGSSIRWTNYDISLHTATSDDGVWDSGELAQYQTYRFTFNTPGVYHYHCTRHGVFHGTITVLACPTTPSPSTTPGTTRTPTFTATPGAATRTPTSATTHTATPGLTTTTTPCTMSFTDVQQSDYFYEAVRYLYCAGAISGYGDGTFRPYNNTTRAQLSKIVVLAQGWDLDCPDAGHFTDVPPDHAFYCYIETAYGHGIITGYGDGTFRPDNNVTRGQLSKIIVQAMGWTDACPSTGHFTDVSVGSTFFCYIETAYGHGIITGYGDGTFRPDNNATRGQISTIIYRAITQP